MDTYKARKKKKESNRGKPKTPILIREGILRIEKLDMFKI